MKFRLIILLMLIFVPLSAYAEESIEVSCKDSNGIYECKLYGNIDYGVSAIDFHVSVPNNAHILSYKIDPRWEGVAENNWISLYSGEDSNGHFPLVTLKIESTSKFNESNVNIYDLLIYDSDYQEHKIENKLEENTNTQENNKIDNKKLLIITICAIIIVGIVVIIKKLKGVSK